MFGQPDARDPGRRKQAAGLACARHGISRNRKRHHHQATLASTKEGDREREGERERPPPSHPYLIETKSEKERGREGERPPPSHPYLTDNHNPATPTLTIKGNREVPGGRVATRWSANRPPETRKSRKPRKARKHTEKSRQREKGATVLAFWLSVSKKLKLSHLFLVFLICPCVFLLFLVFLISRSPGAGWRPSGQGGLPYQEAFPRGFALHTTTQPSGAHKLNRRLACASPGPSRPRGPHEPTPSFGIIGKRRKLSLHRTATRAPGDREIKKTKKSKKT